MALTPEILVPRLGDVLIEQGLLSSTDLDKALDRQKQLRKTGSVPLIGQLLVEMGFISRENLDQAITNQIIKLQSALQDANKNLELRVEQRTAELAVAYKKLSELTELKSNFISNISHELRTPMTHIQGYIDLFLSGDDYSLSDEVKEGLNVMQRSTERLNNLINDLIMFSSTEAGPLQLNQEQFNLVTIAEKCLHRYKTIAEQKGISIQLNCKECEVSVRADEDKIAWVINQLLDNALKYSHHQGRINISIEAESKHAIISVEDDGIGFDPSHIEEVFEPFHQLDGSSRRKQGGTGIGLALAKRILEAHGTTFKVHSQSGKGSCFQFKLPLASNSI